MQAPLKSVFSKYPFRSGRRIQCSVGASDQPVAGKLEAFSSFAANLFPVWLIVAGSAALLKPELFLWFQKDYVTFGLAITMLSMGTSLTLEVN